MGFYSPFLNSKLGEGEIIVKRSSRPARGLSALIAGRVVFFTSEVTTQTIVTQAAYSGQ